MQDVLRWGILGTGNIARQFAAGVAGCERGSIRAVGSRSAATAGAFAGQFGIPAHFGSYEQLLSRPDVNAIYLALPNSMHFEWTIKALHAGKHVLCEKPLAVSVEQARRMFDAARSCGRALIEGFMYRAHPQTLRAVELVRSGAIGNVKLIRTSFCYRVRNWHGNIRFSPDLAGGALMDVGCYCVNFSRLIAGADPDHVHAVTRRHESGVDEQTTACMKYSGGITAEFTCGMMVQADNTAYVCGDEGYLVIAWPWKPTPGNAQILVAHSTPPRQESRTAAPVTPPRQIIQVPDHRQLYAIEADAFASAALDGADPFVTPEESMGVMETMERIRAAG